MLSWRPWYKLDSSQVWGRCASCCQRQKPWDERLAISSSTFLMMLSIASKKTQCIPVAPNVTKADMKPHLRGLIGLRSPHWKTEVLQTYALVPHTCLPPDYRTKRSDLNNDVLALGLTFWPGGIYVNLRYECLSWVFWNGFRLSEADVIQ